MTEAELAAYNKLLENEEMLLKSRARLSFVIGHLLGSMARLENYTGDDGASVIKECLDRINPIIAQEFYGQAPQQRSGTSGTGDQLSDDRDS